MSFLTEEALMQTWGTGTAEPHQIDGAEEFRLETENAAATNGQNLLGDCTPVDAQGLGFTIRCAFDYQDLRSDELGLGPFGDNSTDVVVVNGKITSIVETLPLDTNGYEQQMWDPFQAWLETQHPEDELIFNGSTTEESIRLWEQRSRDWVAARLAAEQGATEFLQAFAAFDAEAASAHLAAAAATERIVPEDVQDYQQAIALYKAMGYEQELGTCRQVNATAAGLEVRCPFAYQFMGSGELGLGPFEGSYFSVVADDSGMISRVVSVWDTRDFTREIGDPFTDWVTTTHPDEAELMSVNASPALTPESLALWEQLRGEYVQYVLSSAPSTTTA